jgi:hypothetical protein
MTDGYGVRKLPAECKRALNRLHPVLGSVIIEIMNKPGIVTAIPKRRYKFGEFTVVILDEISSNDSIDYQFIMAVVRGTDPDPGIYITAERFPQADAGGGDYTMRIIMRDGSEVLGTSNKWKNIEIFANDALDIVSRVLQLKDEVPYRLM